MTQDGVSELIRLAGEFGKRHCVSELVAHRRQGDGHAGHFADQRPPYPRCRNDSFCSDGAAFGHYGAYTAVLDLDVYYPGVTVKRGTPTFGCPRQRLGHPDLADPGPRRRCRANPAW
jgi:hypothetical protein